MKRSWLLLAVGAIVATATITWALWPQVPATLPEDTHVQEHGEVTATATRHAGEQAPVTFTLILDTHTVDLSSYDPLTSTTLDTTAGVLEPLNGSEVVENDGHHVEARLLFDAPPTEAKTLVLHDLADRAEWRLDFIP